MTDTIKDIESLIAKGISGNASKEEISQLEAWKAESERNLQIYRESLTAWENSKKWISDTQVDLDKAKILFEIGRELQKQVWKLRRMSGIFKISAAMSLPLAFAISLYFFQNKKDIVQTVQICSVTAPKGHISKCVLPDGTEVWVNTGSTITYNTSAFNKDTREIHLEGEAYFQVKSGHEKLFRVTTPIADLKVTGTSFNVKAYQGSGIFETVLDEGSINIQLNNRSGQAVLLEPGERAVYDINGKNIQIAHVDTKMYSCWRNGEILFKDATLNDLVIELERIYEIKFNFRDENLRRYRFRGMFSYNNNLIDALEKIKKTAGIAYYIENKEAWLSK